ncbi:MULTISPECIES: hypothetical protein [Microbacterium]|uniref:hypothetical protein n=1 Tax=Microbacterium TaxID=33882 RepID=UPI000D641954|nr:MULTISPECIES: hypothetical protein [Microbacterium]
MEDDAASEVTAMPAGAAGEADDRAYEVAALIAGADHDAAGANPYRKWTGSHWRLVELADLAADGAVVPAEPLRPMFEAEFDWLLGERHGRRIRVIEGRTRRCASQEGNALYAASTLGWAGDERPRELAARLMTWQWPDGGWNCDARPGVTRSSFHESITPALGLVAFGRATGTREPVDAARRTAELLLESHVIHSRRTDEVVHPSWAVPHYPAYWHYDVLQGLRLLAELDLLDDARASDALDVLRRSRRPDGFAGRTWASSRQPSAIERGRGAANRMLNRLAGEVLARA